MDTATIVAELEAERDRLDRAIAAFKKPEAYTGHDPVGPMAGGGDCR